MRQVIHVYAVCYNEAVLLPHFLRYYSAFAERITVCDGGSADGSPDIIRSFPNTVCVSCNHESYNETVLMDIRNTAYKKSRGQARWVMVCDIDEFVWHPHLLDVLNEYDMAGVTLPRIAGYDMVSKSIPDDIFAVKHGFLNPGYAKQAIFDPEIDINYLPGCHWCAPNSGKHSESSDIKLLHYRFLGEDFFVRKYSQRHQRMSQESANQGHGCSIPVPGGNGILYHNLYHPNHDLVLCYKAMLEGQNIEAVIP